MFMDNFTFEMLHQTHLILSGGTSSQIQWKTSKFPLRTGISPRPLQIQYIKNKINFGTPFQTNCGNRAPSTASAATRAPSTRRWRTDWPIWNWTGTSPTAPGAAATASTTTTASTKLAPNSSVPFPIAIIRLLVPPLLRISDAEWVFDQNLKVAASLWKQVIKMVIITYQIRKMPSKRRVTKQR